MLNADHSHTLLHWTIDEMQSHYERLNSPFILLKPRMFPDGNQWCALYGDNLQDGVAGFGDTPAEAENDFNRNWSGQRISKENGK